MHTAQSVGPDDAVPRAEAPVIRQPPYVLLDDDSRECPKKQPETEASAFSNDGAHEICWVAAHQFIGVVRTDRAGMQKNGVYRSDSFSGATSDE